MTNWKPQHGVVISGQRWYEKNSSESAFWTVTAISDEGLIGLTGPGPCRSYQTVPDDEFLRDWALCEHQPKRRDER